jgi:hypothetical protein
LGAFPKTISGMSVLLPYPMVIQQGWVGGSYPFKTIIRAGSMILVQPSIISLPCFYNWFPTRWQSEQASM